MSDVGPWTKYADAQPAAMAPAEGPWAKFQKAAGGIVDAVVDAGKSVVNAVRGENEFEHPELMSVGGPIRDINLATKLYRARDEAAMLDVLRDENPQTTTSKDKFGNTVVNYDGKPYYLNRSGLSGRDMAEFGRDMTVTMPFSGAAGAITKGASLAVRAIGQAVAGLFGSVATDAVSTIAGSQQGLDVPAAAASMLGGAGGEVLGSAGAAIFNRIRNNPARFVTRDGSLTPAGRDIFTEAGLNPDDISHEIAGEFAKRARSTGPTPATAREVAAGEFGVPLTRGQATGDFDEIAFEQSAKAGARGSTAGGIMRGKFERQNDAIDAAKENIGTQLAPSVGTRSPQDSAAVVLDGLRARERAHGQMVDAAYDQARELGKGAMIHKDAIEQVPQLVRDALRDANVRILPGSKVYPAAQEAIELINQLPTVGDLTTKSGKANSPVGVALGAIEEVRKAIGGREGILAGAANDADRRAVRTVVKAFDGWLDDVADHALMSGDTAAIQQLKNARAAASKHFGMFSERGNVAGGDDAGRAIERMIDADVTGQEVANFIYGSSKVGDSGRAVRVTKRLEEITGRQGPEWEALRAGMWQRLTQNAEGKDQPGAQAISQSIFEFVNGRGKGLAERLYTTDELGMMRRFAAMLRGTVPPKSATNPSGSGYELARIVGGMSFIGSPIGIRYFDQARNLTSTGRALFSSGGAPKARNLGGPLPAAVGAVTGERELTDDR